MDEFKLKVIVLDKEISGWSLLETIGEIAGRIRKYMLIRTLASVATGVAVFVFTLSVGLELAVAWGVISFVLNYIPYVGSLIAVVLPVIFATAQFESWQMAAFIFGSFTDPIRHRQLSGAHSDRQCAFNFTLRDAIGVFSMGLSLGHAGRLHRAPGDDCAFHDLATESFD